MSIRNLDSLFKPRSIALIGASKSPSSVGAVLARNLFRGGFEGPIMPVHPKHQHIHSVTAYPDVASLPMAPELAVIATPPDTVPGLIAALGERGTKAAVVITAGFGEGARAEGHALRQAMLDAARPNMLRVVGPNCLGIMVPGSNLNAGFAAAAPMPGHLAFVTQSGAIVASVLDWAAGRGIGFSHLVSLGGMADVDFGDMLDYLANDRGTRAILLYIEAVTHARKFMSAARAAARMKPVIVVKAGRHAEGARAAASHTGALAGLDVVYETAIRRAGMLRVYSLEELFDAVETLSREAMPSGDRLAIVTNGGGMGVLATDALIDVGGNLAPLSVETIAALDAVLPPTWSRANPLDIIGDASGQRYAQTLGILFDDPDIDAVLVLNCPTAVASGVDAAKAVIGSLSPRQRTPVLTSWVGGSTARDARRLFSDAGLATYDTPTQAVRAFMHMVTYRRNQKILTETPAAIPQAFTPDKQAARRIVTQALEEGRDLLNEFEAKELLSAYKIAVVATRVAKDAREAATFAAEIGGSVALKIVSPDITHKTDVGGVALELVGPRAVHDAALAMAERIAARQPAARIEGFAVQPMIRRPGAFELILGVVEDPQFGPMLVIGQGGTAVEIVDDTAFALPPLNMRLAKEAISRTRVSRLLAGYRGFPAADLDAIALTMIKLSQLVIDFAELKELDINPLLADEFGVVALDARVRVAATAEAPENRLAIRPYPNDLEEEIQLVDGRGLVLRPVIPEDEPALQAGFAHLTPEEVRLRFFVPMKTLSHVQAARFTQIDYDREMALVLTEAGIPGTKEIFGVVRIFADPDNEKAEFAIIVRGDMTGQGHGRPMMQRIIDYSRRRGIGEIFGEVLRENKAMLGLCRDLGFDSASHPDEPDLRRVSLKLQDRELTD